jgi:hypothetical protein
MSVKASVQLPAVASVSNNSFAVGSNTSSPTIAFGTGAPATNHVTGVSSSTSGIPVTGSMYIRTDGAANSRIYFYYPNSWIALSGI